ncbi:MAG: hypothetical protein HY560_06105, partial [Gemmatimonadetes bacterium]|nr:hypothetical protein [Gemmatimonadota bacterium]
MFDLLAYLGLTCLNLAILVGIVRWRSWLSFEGLGSLLLLVVIGSDAVALLVSYLVSPTSDEAVRELQGRVYPTLVHTAGLAALTVGLVVGNPKPVPLQRDLKDTDRRLLVQVGRFLVVFGLGMKLVSMYVGGVRSLGQYLTQLYFYTVYQ